MGALIHCRWAAKNLPLLWNSVLALKQCYYISSDFTQNIYKVEWKTVNTKIFLQLLIAALFTTVKMEITKAH